MLICYSCDVSFLNRSTHYDRFLILIDSHHEVLFNYVRTLVKSFLNHIMYLLIVLHKHLIQHLLIPLRAHRNDDILKIYLNVIKDLPLL